MTLVEILVVVALTVVVTSIYFLVANPAGQLASSRNNERQFQLQAIMNGIRQNIADQGNEQFACASGAIPTTTTKMASASGSYNIAPCLIPTYGLFTMPFDPNASSAYYTSVTNYNTGYTIAANASGSITLSAPYAELKKTISVTR